MLHPVGREQTQTAVVQAERHLGRDLAVRAAQHDPEVVRREPSLGGLVVGGGDGLELGGVGGGWLWLKTRRGGTIAVDEISPLSYPVAFAAGFVSFASPCVLALVPGYLCFISGVSFDELGSRTRDVLTPTIAFVVGFSLMFTAYGASAGLVGYSSPRTRTRSTWSPARS